MAAVIQRDGAYLICKRPEHKRHGGLWEFPGGKVLPGESREDAIRRELVEELGVQTESVGSTLHAVRDPGTPFLILFATVKIKGEPQPVEHTDVRWCSLPGLSRYSLAPSDQRFVEEHLKHKRT